MSLTLDISNYNMIYVESKKLSLKNKRFTPLGCKNIEYLILSQRLNSFMSDYRSEIRSFNYKIILIWFYIITELLVLAS